MYQALYRKYRPQTFDDMVGQAHLLGANGALRRIVKHMKRRRHHVFITCRIPIRLAFQPSAPVRHGYRRITCYAKIRIKTIPAYGGNGTVTHIRRKTVSQNIKDNRNILRDLSVSQLDTACRVTFSFSASFSCE